MILSDRDILAYLEAGKIKITPPIDATKQLSSCSVDFRLGNTFMVFEHSRFGFMDPRSSTAVAESMRKIVVPDGEAFMMQPGDFVLASTIEKLELPDNLVGRLEGRSSLARLGIIVHSTAALFEPGWIGTATMELGNLGRIAVALYPGMRVCAFTFDQLSSPALTPYRLKPGNKYAGQINPEPSKLSAEAE